MRTPFRHQASEYDCVPTTALNALAHLYDRDEIPPIAVQRIFTYCLDSISARNGLGYGTSSHAVQLLGSWLNQYQHKRFRTRTNYLCKDEVNLRQNNKIVQALNSGGNAMLSLTTRSPTFTHFVLALGHDANWIYAFDPYPKRRSANKKGKYEFIEPEHAQAANLRINRTWLESTVKKEPYHFGPIEEREVLLLQRAGA